MYKGCRAQKPAAFRRDSTLFLTPWQPSEAQSEGCLHPKQLCDGLKLVRFSMQLGGQRPGRQQTGKELFETDLPAMISCLTDPELPKTTRLITFSSSRTLTISPTVQQIQFISHPPLALLVYVLVPHSPAQDVIAPSLPHRTVLFYQSATS